MDKGQNHHGDASQDRSSVNTYTHTVRERERESDPMYPSSSSWLNESCCVGPKRTLYGGGCHTIIGSYVATICKEVRGEKLKEKVVGCIHTHRRLPLFDADSIGLGRRLASPMQSPPLYSYTATSAYMHKNRIVGTAFVYIFPRSSPPSAKVVGIQRRRRW